MPTPFRKLRGFGLAASLCLGGLAASAQAQGVPPAPGGEPGSRAPAAESSGVTTLDKLVPKALSSKPESQGDGSAAVGKPCDNCQQKAAKSCSCSKCSSSNSPGNLCKALGLDQHVFHHNGYNDYNNCSSCNSSPSCDSHGGGSRTHDYLAEKFNRDRLRGRLGYFIPEGGGGHGVPWMGHYHMGYAVNPYHFDPRDAGVYAAQGYGVPMTVPLAPNVEHQYNYGWGVPSSRLTGVYRYVREPGVIGPEGLQGVYPVGGPLYGNAHPFVGAPGR